MTAIGVTGHQDIPDNALDFIEDGIRRTLEEFRGDFVGITSLAAGADQIFARIVLTIGGSLRAVIPSARYESAFEEQATRRQYELLLEGAAEIETLPFDSPCQSAYLAAGKRIVDLSDMLVAIWDGKEAKGKGGTADTVRYARKQGIKVIVIWPPGIDREQTSNPDAT
jgi:hypothetical protein